MTFSPSIGPRLVELVDQLDDGKTGIAAIWRELGHLARAQRLFQPSYESVRRLVHALREWRRLMRLRARRAAVLMVDVLPALRVMRRERADRVRQLARRL